MTRRQYVVLSVVVFLSFLSGGWLLEHGAQPSRLAYQRARMLQAVLEHVEDFYVDSIAEDSLYDMAIDGLLQQLHDPYSVMLRPDDFRDLTVTTSGNYSGVGIQIDIRDGWITVVAPLPDTPAERAGILPGDRVIGVDGISTHDWPNDRALTELRGKVGTPVKLTVQRAGVAQPMTFQLDRAEIHVRSVQFGMLVAPAVGYVQLVTVSDSSSEELAAAIDSLRGQGARGIIVDLRNNPGGLLDQGIAVSDLFLDKDQQVLATRGRMSDATATYTADHPDRWPGLPVVVLINEGTASAAEIIAGALQDHDRAVLVGATTFGKGLVQTIFPLGATEAVKLTTARWYTPSGRSIQKLHHGDSDDSGVATATLEEAAADTAPRFRTDDGRPLRGGGGIRPDLQVADTLTRDAHVFVQALGGNIQTYRDVLTAYALDLKARHAVHDSTFRVTPEMLAQVRQRLATRHVTMTDAAWNAGAELVSRQIGGEVTRYMYGRPAEFRRVSASDGQLQRAIALLEQAHTPADLIRLASPKRP